MKGQVIFIRYSFLCKLITYTKNNSNDIHTKMQLQSNNIRIDAGMRVEGYRVSLAATPRAAHFITAHWVNL